MDHHHSSSAPADTFRPATLAADLSLETAAGCLAYARTFGDNQPMRHDGSIARADAYAWVYHRAHPVTADLFPDAAGWLAEEHRLDQDEFDGARRWGTPLQARDRIEALIISRERDGSMHIWDGNHRMAQAIVQQMPVMPMVIGTPQER